MAIAPTKHPLRPPHLLAQPWMPLVLSIASAVTLAGGLLSADSGIRPLLLLALLLLGGAIAQALFLQRLSFWRTPPALGESEAKFATIFRTSPDPVAIVTLAEGRLLEVNDSLVEFVGYSRAELIGRTTLELNLWQEPSARMRYRALLHQQGQVRNLEVLVRTKTGQVKTGLLSAEVQLLDGQACVISVLRDITERQRCEAALTQTETRLRKTEQWLGQYSQLSPGKIYTLVQEADGHLWFEYISSAVETINEVTAQAVLENAQVIFDMFHPEDVAGYEAAARESMQTLKPFSHQWRIITPSGRVKWVQDYAQPSRSKTGATIWHGVVIDISDRARLEAERTQNEAKRQQMEVALQESETRFRQLAEAVKEGFFVYDVETTHYAYVNPAYWQIRGIAPDYGPDSEAQWLARIHSDDRDRIVAALERERQGENFDQEYRYITPSGELRWLRSKAFPLLDAGGKVVRVVGTVENITDRKLTEAALRQSEARFRSAFDDAPYGISLVDTQGQFVLANAYYCGLLGYSEAELLTLSFSDITHPDDRNEDWAGFQHMMGGTTRTYQMEKRYLSKQGDTIPVIVNAAPIYDDEGKPLYSVGHVQDIRDRLAIDRMKDEFISVVSHELRTPITSIQGALALLGAGVYAGRPEKAQHMLNIAINNSARLVRLVDDILSFERLESGKVQLEKEDCAIAHLLYQAIDSVQPLADRSGITIALTPVTATVWAAPDGVIQVLTNLLSNAIKFSSPGGTVWLKAGVVGSGEWGVGVGGVGGVGGDGGVGGVGGVGGDGAITGHCASPPSPPSPPSQPSPPSPPSPSLHHPRPPTPHLLLTVRDHGRGIPSDKLETIFDQFQQVDASDSRQRGGTGLGLAICKRIVQQHRGRIWVESDVGQGSTFSVALPLAREDGYD